MEYVDSKRDEIVKALMAKVEELEERLAALEAAKEGA